MIRKQGANYLLKEKARDAPQRRNGNQSEKGAQAIADRSVQHGDGSRAEAFVAPSDAQGKKVERRHHGHKHPLGFLRRSVTMAGARMPLAVFAIA
ncbi:MAG: hypothetical protein INR62_04515 [Rhodospirillales bacterium]|nr:hypothetical protein [Acetobacter sp.]